MEWHRRALGRGRGSGAQPGGLHPLHPPWELPGAPPVPLCRSLPSGVKSLLQTGLRGGVLGPAGAHTSPGWERGMGGMEEPAPPALLPALGGATNTAMGLRKVQWPPGWGGHPFFLLPSLPSFSCHPFLLLPSLPSSSCHPFLPPAIPFLLLPSPHRVSSTPGCPSSLLQSPVLGPCPPQSSPVPSGPEQREGHPEESLSC